MERRNINGIIPNETPRKQLTETKKENPKKEEKFQTNTEKETPPDYNREERKKKENADKTARVKQRR